MFEMSLLTYFNNCTFTCMDEPIMEHVPTPKFSGRFVITEMPSTLVSDRHRISQLLKAIASSPNNRTESFLVFCAPYPRHRDCIKEMLMLYLFNK